MNDPLLKLREEFPILSTCTYMVSHSLGAARLIAAASVWRP